MSRTNVTAVRSILGRNYDGTTDLQQFIDSAKTLVDRVVDCATKRKQPLTADEQELVERWLAAHMYCQVDIPEQSKSTGGSSGQFMGQTSTSIASTRYGQTALNLDTSGCLSAISLRQTAGGFALRGGD